MIRSAVLHVRDPLYLNAYALMASNLLSSALGVVYWALAARSYSVDSVGIGAATISLVVFLSGIAQLNLRTALVRLVPEAGSRTPALVGAAYLASSGMSVVAAVVTFVGASIVGIEPFAGLARDVSVAVPSVVLLAGAIAAWSVFNIQDGLLAGLRRTLWVPVENVLYGVAKTVLLVVLAAGLPVLGIAVSWFVPVVAAVAVVTVIVAIRWIPQHVRAAPHGPPSEARLVDERGRLLRYVASDYAAALFALATSSLLPVLVAATRGPAEGAFFYLAWIIAVSLDLLPANTAASLTVETASGQAELATETRRALMHMARSAVPFALVVAIVAPLLLQVFGATYAERSTDLLRLLALGVIPYVAISAALAVARVRGRSRELLAIQASLAVLTLGGSALLVGPLGLAGVGVAVLVARLLVAGVLVVARIRPLLSAHGGLSQAA